MAAERDLTVFQVPEGATLRDALAAMDKGAFGVVFFVDGSQKVLGILTDGDVRRALLGGADLDESSEIYVNRNFAFGTPDEPREHQLAKVSEKVKHLPILDKEGRLVDLWSASWRLPVMSPLLSGNEMAYVMDCVRSNWVSSQGPYVRLFESNFADYLGVGHAAASSSGTAALHLAMLALGVGEGDEVIVPDLTFAATANAVIHARATPVFVDVSEETWTMDPSQLSGALSKKTKAIIPVHLYGHPCDMDPIMDFAQQHKLFVIEDCAESLGATYKGKHLGTFGDMGCFSFFSNKIITTGEGGMVTTQKEELHHRVMTFRDHGMTKGRRYWHEVVGYNYRMTNLQAALGVAQLEQLNRLLEKRKVLADRYSKGFSGVSGITLPPGAPWAKTVCWLYSVLIDEDEVGFSRDELLQRLDRERIDTRYVFPSLHEQPALKQYAKQREYPVSTRLSRQGMSLPSGYDLTNEEVDRIVETVRTLMAT